MIHTWKSSENPPKKYNSAEEYEAILGIVPKWFTMGEYRETDRDELERLALSAKPAVLEHGKRMIDGITDNIKYVTSMDTIRGPVG